MVTLRDEIDLGEIVLRPAAREVSGPLATRHVEPLVMRLLSELALNAGRLNTRAKLFEVGWGGTAMGDDSLNRIVAAARRALRETGGGRIAIDTVPATGYILNTANLEPMETGQAEAAWRAGLDSWRMAFPVPDYLAMERLRRVVSTMPGRADFWGMLALLYRHAAEYGEAEERPAFVLKCERAAANAFAIEPDQAEAAVALTSVVPIFGNWAEAHDRLSAIATESPNNAIAAHDLAIIEMSTGRVRVAKATIDRLIAADPLAPCYAYKSTYHHWTLGDLETMDQRADRAFQLWPQHPAIWTARFWTLAFTGRIPAALQMLSAEAMRPPIPASLADFLQAVLRSALDQTSDAERLAQRAVDAVGIGPAQAVNSLMALGLLGDVERSYAVADAFYCREGAVTVPIHSVQLAPVNEMGRRLTQVLFTPACAAMRDDPRFELLCERIGLVSYWEATFRQPDFRHAH